MPQKKHKPEEIVAKLRQVDVLLSQGRSVGEAVRLIGVTQFTYYRWRKEFGGLKGDQVKRLKELEKENDRLRKAVSDLTLEKLILDVISLDYHETLFAAAGHQVEAARKTAMAENKGQYILVVEGAIPTRDGGIYCKIGGKTAIELLKECAADAAAVIAIGSCASWGGMPSTDPNPTGAMGVDKVLGKPVVTIPGCPPNPYNFLSTVVHFLTFGALPAVDHLGRPKFAYSRLVHENCERRAHFDAGRFAMDFGDDGHRKGYCLYKLGCKGPETYANCPTIQFGDAGAGTWPVGCGHPCIGCTEQGVGFEKPIHAVAKLKNIEPSAFLPRIVEEKGVGASLGSAAVLAAVAGAAAGAGAMVAKNLGLSHKAEQMEEAKKSGEKAEV